MSIIGKTRPSAAIISWILYDFGMAWFSLVVITAYYILYFKEVVVGGDKGYGDFLWGITVSTAMLLSVVLSPLLGAVADMRRNKKTFLIACCRIVDHQHHPSVLHWTESGSFSNAAGDHRVCRLHDSP